MRLFRPLFFTRLIYPGAVFRIDNGSRDLFLTFDDGPDSESTPLILEILETHGVKAIFFCAGLAAEQHPDLIGLIISKGHIIGNHGYNHLDGWRTSDADYLADVSKAAIYTSSYLFRPPYGRIRPSQYRLLKKDYHIIFWDLMPYDFDSAMTSEKILRTLKRKVRAGSVIVLHDKGISSDLKFLEQFICFVKEEGYNFRIMTNLK
jgi:peptidoglycan/xylan/chitin deacetylase (PgdA/CDA1 family)